MEKVEAVFLALWTNSDNIRDGGRRGKEPVPPLRTLIYSIFLAGPKDSIV